MNAFVTKYHTKCVLSTLCGLFLKFIESDRYVNGKPKFVFINKKKISVWNIRVIGKLLAKQIQINFGLLILSEAYDQLEYYSQNCYICYVQLISCFEFQVFNLWNDCIYFIIRFVNIVLVFPP